MAWLARLADPPCCHTESPPITRDRTRMTAKKTDAAEKIADPKAKTAVAKPAA